MAARQTVARASGWERRVAAFASLLDDDVDTATP
jgi:hypothetical protein